MTKLHIVNARMVNEGRIQATELLIENGRIQQIGDTLGQINNAQILDAEGKWLFPGMIDDQVHFREPGATHKGDIAHESRAAVAGGITSYMEMPNTNPLTITLDALEAKYALAENRSCANYAFYLGGSNDNLEQIKRLDPKQACGVKVFMGASTGNMLVDDPQALENIFAHSPILIATHCEDTPTILANEARFQQQYGDKLSAEQHPLIRSVDACYQSSSLAVSLAKKHHSRLHVLHLTTAKELELFTAGDLRNKRITVEACVHHLFFNAADYAAKGNLIKCNPAIKSAADQQALQQAVLNDTIDVIATDHAPHTLEEKQRPYAQAPAGLPLVQHALLSLLEHYHNGLMSLETIVQKTSHAPAQLFDLVDRGFIREGYWADLVLIDPNKPYRVTTDNLFAKCQWSPFMDYEFRSSIDTTLVNGIIVYQNGKILSQPVGKRLEFRR